MSEKQWKIICEANDLQPMLGVRALVSGKQVAVFRVKEKIYAIDAVDPFTKAAVLSRGIVGDLKGQLVVASPIYKQHFSLDSGCCVEDETASVAVYDVRERDGVVEVAA